VTSRQTTLSPDELIALSREIQAMIEADVPLDLGLSSAAGGFSTRLEEATRRVADRMSQGLSLPEAMEQESAIPAAYRAILVAGLRCGRSQEVLDELCRMTGVFQNLRQALYGGLIYPVSVVIFAGALFVFIGTTYLPALIALYESIPVEVPGWLAWFHRISLPVVGAVMAGAVVVTFLLYSRGRRSDRILRGFFWVPHVARDVRLAQMSHILSLLTNYGVPLPEALKLTAGTVESGQLRQQLLDLSEAVERGEPFAGAVTRQEAFSPWLRWVIATGTRNSSLTETLRQAAEFYRGRAESHAQVIRTLVPMLAVLVLGGSVTLLYALSVFGPMTELWVKLGVPS
jgi:type II secretory pathway component PulF